MRTTRERYIAGLFASGERLVKTTGRYDVFTCRTGGYFYVGHRGALRIGDTITGSIPAPLRLKLAVLDAAAVTVGSGQ